jgi:predicted amidohydrolase
MTAQLADVNANLLKAERLARLAFKRGARWVVLPEFFTSAIAFHPDMAKATEEVDGRPSELLCRLARESKAFVGGSFLAWRGGNAYNSFILALPNGKTLRHDKDYPSYWEACYYVGGSDDGVLSTPDGNVGVALCFEFVRSRTAARLKGKVGMVVGGSCWWGMEDTARADHPLRKWLLDLLQATPGRFARLLGVPVIHASHAGRFEGRSWPGEPTPFPSSYLGETQIVNGRGEILARMAREDGEGVITADVALGEVPGERVAIPDRFWIPEMPAEEIRQWRAQLKSGHEFYVSNTLPALKRRFNRSVTPTRD